MKNRYPTGVVAVDSTANELSSVYGDKFAKQSERFQRQETHSLQRSKFLKEKWNANERLGYALLQHAIIPNQEYDNGNGKRIIQQAESKGSLKPLMQTKGRGTAAPNAIGMGDTNERIFGEDKFVVNEARRQHLHDQDVGGKTYDLTGTHKLHVLQPCKYIPKLREDKKLIHPSQVSHEQQRNLQGAVKITDHFINPYLDPAY